MGCSQLVTVREHPHFARTRKTELPGMLRNSLTRDANRVCNESRRNLCFFIQSKLNGAGAPNCFGWEIRNRKPWLLLHNYEMFDVSRPIQMLIKISYSYSKTL